MSTISQLRSGRTGITVAVAAFALTLLMSTLACNASPAERATPEPLAASTPMSVVYSGADSFANRCAVCHGAMADGTDVGPPLVNKLYEVGHHPDFSFRNAVNNGVTAHHWHFGDMPPIPNVMAAEIDAIICHVRDLQRASGIDGGEAC